MFSQTVEYSLRAVAALAARHDDPMTVEQISELAHIPRPYLSKIMQNLVRAELVRSQRGRRGGFVLAKLPKETTIWDIVTAVHPVKHIHSCPLEQEGQRARCPLHRRIDQAVQWIEKSFRDTTLQTLIDECDAHTPLCISVQVENKPAATKKKRLGSKDS